MNLLKVIFCSLFVGLFLIVECEYDPNISNSEPDKPDTTETLVRYVSPSGTGSKTGDSKDNAADFLDTDFWNEISGEIEDTPIRVQFLEGEYTRAFTEKPLVLTRIGHPNHTLILKGGDDVIFKLEKGKGWKKEDRVPFIIKVKGAQNIVFDNFHFTGNGSVGYVLPITSKLEDSSIPTTNITVKNSSFKDMRGVYYGATGAHYEQTSHITYKNITFKRIGVDGHSHFIYNAYGSSHINIKNCHFEDCTGDFVRFRDRCEYGLVKGSTFLKNKMSGHAFIAIPVFNDVDPGDETFPTNLAFVNNKFINNTADPTENAIKFHHSGYNPPGWDYLLTEEEGKILQKGNAEQKTKLLHNNFDVYPNLIRMFNNTFSTGITREFGLKTKPANGAESKGFAGSGDITGTINRQPKPFDWEP